MVDVTSRLRLVVDSSNVDRAGKSLRNVREEARQLDAQAKLLMGAFRQMAAVAGTVLGVQAVIRYADGWKRAENQLKTVTGSMMAVKSAQEGLFAVAQKTFSAYEATAALYTKLSRAGAGFIDGQKEALRLVETVNKALAVGGASASERSSVILQLGQAVGSGRLQGDEFRSISENAPLILDALAKSTGIARGALKELGAEGKITSQVLIKAIRDYGDEVDTVFGKFAPTVEDSLTKVKNAFQKLVGERGSLAFTSIAVSLGFIADHLTTIADLALLAGTALTAAFASKMLIGIGAAVAQMVALEFALGATTTAAALQSIAIKGLQGAWAGFMGLVGGPVGLAMIAVTVALGGLAAAIMDANKDLESLKTQTETAGSVIEKYQYLLNPASIDTQKLGDMAEGAGVKIESFAGKTGKAAQSLYDYAKAQKMAALADVERESLGLRKSIVDNTSRLPAGRRDDDKELQKALSFGEQSRFKNPAEFFKAAGNVFGGDTLSWWTGGQADDDRLAQIDEATKRLKELEKIGNQIGAKPLDDKVWAKGFGDGIVKGAKAAKDATDALFHGLDRVKGKMDDFRSSLDYGLINPLEGLGKTAKRVSDSTVDALNAISSRARLRSALATGGIEAYEDQLEFEEKLKAAIGDEVFALWQKQAAIKATARATRDEADETARLHREKERVYQLQAKQVLGRADDATAAAFDQFFDDIPHKGLAAFTDLFDNVGDIFKQVWSDAMKAGLDPFISKLRERLSDTYKDVFSKTQKFLTDALSKISPEMGEKVSKLVSKGLETYAGYQVGSSAAHALGLGGKSDAQKQNGTVGGGVGAVIGSIWGPIGSAIGSFIGTTIGGLLGPSSTNAAASSILDALGKSTSGMLGDKRTAETSQALNDFMTVLQSGYASLKDLGGVMSTYVKNIEIGQRDPSKIDLSDGRQVQAAVGDTAAAQNAALIEVLRGTTFATASLNLIKDGMIAAGSSFEDTYGILTKVNALLKSNEPAMSQWVKSLQEFEAALTGDALRVAKDALAGAFNQTVSQRRLELEDPVGAELKAVGQSVAGLIKDAKALGVAMGEGSDVFAVVGDELSAVFQKAIEDATGATDLTQQLAKLKAVLEGLGVSADYASAAIGKGLGNSRDTFNDKIKAELGGILNGPLDQLNALLKTQASRLEMAKALGADLSAVERLTALEQRNFFQGLSEDAIKEVESFLGIFEEATNSVVRNLDLSRQDLTGRAAAFGQFAEQFSQLSSDYTERFLAASPRESIGVLRGRVEELLGGVANGNDSAAQALPNVIGKLVDAARSTYGNTQSFNDILAFAQAALGTAKASALNVQTETERQIAVLDKSYDVLNDIKDILSSSQATNAYFQSYLSGGVASSDALMALLTQGAGLNLAANNNNSSLNITGLIGQSIQPLIAPLATSIDVFTARLADLPNLQRLTIEAVDRGTDRLEAALHDISDRLDQIETLEKKQLAALDQSNRAA